MRLVACAAAPSVDPRVRRVAHLVQPREVVVAADGEVEARLLGAHHVADQVLRPGLLGHHRVAQLHAHAARLPRPVQPVGAQPGPAARSARSASRSFVLPARCAAGRRRRSRPPSRTISAIATSMRTTASATSHSATSPAACRTGITSGESPGTYEVITRQGAARVGRGLDADEEARRRARSVVGMMTRAEVLLPADQRRRHGEDRRVEGVAEHEPERRPTTRRADQLARACRRGRRPARRRRRRRR